MSRLARATAFFHANPRTALGLAAFFTLGGVASVLGYLRPQLPLLQWGLATFLWAVAALAAATAIRALRR